MEGPRQARGAEPTVPRSGFLGRHVPSAGEQSLSMAGVTRPARGATWAASARFAKRRHRGERRGCPSENPWGEKATWALESSSLPPPSKHMSDCMSLHTPTHTHTHSHGHTHRHRHTDGCYNCMYRNNNQNNMIVHSCSRAKTCHFQYTHTHTHVHIYLHFPTKKQSACACSHILLYMYMQ